MTFDKDTDPKILDQELFDTILARIRYEVATNGIRQYVEANADFIKTVIGRCKNSNNYEVNTRYKEIAVAINAETDARNPILKINDGEF